MKKKIIIISGILVVLICIVVAVIFICNSNKNDELNGVLDNNELEENKQNVPIVPPDGSTITNTPNENASDSIPEIKEPQVNVTPTDKNEIDVGEMTRNPEAEVVGGEVEYDTKENE